MEKSGKAGSGYQLRSMIPEEVKLKKIRMCKLGDKVFFSPLDSLVNMEE